jgi:hypothetical protein
MNSIVLSFVGQQDPLSGHTNTEGSIVTLIRHLLAQQNSLEAILLLYTQGTAQGAIETRDWLEAELSIPAAQVELIAVDEALSKDPVDLLAAVAAVKDLLLRTKALQKAGDRLEMNASSGTPAMKSVWGIVQAAGYVTNGRVWQVRNPKELRADQKQVFAADMGVLRQEFDRRVIEQQLASYNYSGALVTLTASGLGQDVTRALLQYGHSRSSFDFQAAGEQLKSHRNQVPIELCQDIDRLRKDEPEALLCDVYWSTAVHLKNRHYCNFMTAVVQFQENALRLFLARAGLAVPDNYQQAGKFWRQVQESYGGLWEELHDRYETKSYIRTQGELNNPTMIAILECLPDANVPIEQIKSLKKLCDQRNKYIHKLVGVSEIPEAPDVLKKMRTILLRLTTLPSVNPFDQLNQAVLDDL